MDNFVVGQKPRTFRELVASHCYFNSIGTHVIVPTSIGPEGVVADIFGLADGNFESVENNYYFQYFSGRDYHIVSQENLSHLSPESNLMKKLHEKGRVVVVDHTPLVEIMV